MRTAHLFAGAGGGILADLILGHEPIVAIEWNQYACKILRKRFPDLRVIEADIRTVDFVRELVGIDALCAGFPCTDISAANPNGLGVHGEMSGLFREVMRAIDAVRPNWVFLENSPRIRTKGRSTVIQELVARGYSWRDGVLGAVDCGAPHKRDRWWLLATNRHQDDQSPGVQINGGRIVQGTAIAGQGVPDLGDSSGNGLQDAVPWSGEIQGNEETVKTTSGPSVGPAWWEVEPALGRVAYGVANWSHRIERLGNGQVPICAAVAWKLLGGP
jgi:DNA (cytosine-5)-methyltransferase 1